MYTPKDETKQVAIKLQDMSDAFLNKVAMKLVADSPERAQTLEAFIGYALMDRDITKQGRPQAQQEFNFPSDEHIRQQIEGGG